MKSNTDSVLRQNYNAKLSDFGLAKLGPTGSNSHITTRVMGTYGYAAPEYVATGMCPHAIMLPTSWYLLSDAASLQWTVKGPYASQCTHWNGNMLRIGLVVSHNKYHGIFSLQTWIPWQFQPANLFKFDLLKIGSWLMSIWVFRPFLVDLQVILIHVFGAH